MASSPPPCAVRVLQYHDRIVLHDLTFILQNTDVSNRNSLIDAANSVNSQHPRRTVRAPIADVDLLGLNDIATPTLSASSFSQASHRNDRYLVLPFAPVDDPRAPPSPFTSTTPPASPVSVDAVPAFLGIIPLHSAVHAIFATQVRRAGTLPSGPVYAVTKVSLLRLAALSPLQPKDDRDISAAISKVLESGHVYYSVNTNLSQPLSNPPMTPSQNKRPFFWNFPLVSRIPPEFRAWCPICIYGFVTAHPMTFIRDSDGTLSSSLGMTSFNLTLISRRSRRRAGTRYITRGVDAMGDVANFVETEQVVWRSETDPIASYTIIRGSIPIFWRQIDGIARPAPKVDPGLVPSRHAFARHFASLATNYGIVRAISLIDKRGAEASLAQAYDRHFELYLASPAMTLPPPSLLAFDFHAHCAGKEYARGLSTLMQQISDDDDAFSFNIVQPETSISSSTQTGVFRVNCVDCLDRTNVVQSMIARAVLSNQLRAVFAKIFTDLPTGNIALSPDAEDRFKHIWGDNADAISKQYAGTGALKTDFTRTGKRSTTGVIGDGVKSVMRMYNKLFVDEGRQEIIDILCANACIRPFATPETSVGRNPSISGKTSTSTNVGSGLGSSLWYSFEAMRINAAGDRQSVYIELHDEVMYVTTSDGVSFEYPRNALIAWSKGANPKSFDRQAPAKIRLVYKPSYSLPATTYPLDLQFRDGVTMRENFLRALISWARPEPAKLLTGAEVRVRVFAALHVGECRLSDWDLERSAGHDESNVLIAIVVPECNSDGRPHGLAAVPVDVDNSDLVVLAALSVSAHGPAIAILASADVARTTMNVEEATWASSGTFNSGGAVAVAVEACGASFCFVSVRVDNRPELSAALTGLKLGRSKLDMSVQFDHVWISGIMGGIKVENEGRRIWTQAEDGGLCYSLTNGLSVLRYSLPTLRYSEKLHDRSLWKGNTVPVHTEPTWICLADSLVDGRKVPQLPKTPCRSVVVLSDLRAENVSIPMEIETQSLMTCSVMVDCELSQSEPAVSRATIRPTTNPVWTEKLRLTMMPCDPDDIFDSFVVGQIVVPNVIGDPVVAGDFVVPLALARDGVVGFDVRCRLGACLTGRVVGRVHVGLQPADTLNAKTDGQFLEHQLDKASVSQGISPAVAERKVGVATKKSQLDEVNEKFGVARRKGARQVKSMVSRLSSLLSQPTAVSSSGPSGTSWSERPSELTNTDLSAAQRTSTRVKSENLKSAKTAQGLTDNTDAINGGDKWWSNHTDATRSQGVQELIPTRWNRASAPPVSASGSGEQNISNNLVEGLDTFVMDRRGSQRAKQSLASTADSLPGTGMSHSQTRAGDNIPDALLLGLSLRPLEPANPTNGGSGVMSGHLSSNKQADKGTKSSSDVLLSKLTGLSNDLNKKKPQAEIDDAWGEFESAEPRTNDSKAYDVLSRPEKDSSGSKSSSDDLIQW